MFEWRVIQHDTVHWHRGSYALNLLALLVKALNDVVNRNDSGMLTTDPVLNKFVSSCFTPCQMGIYPVVFGVIFDNMLADRLEAPENPRGVLLNISVVTNFNKVRLFWDFDFLFLDNLLQRILLFLELLCNFFFLVLIHSQHSLLHHL